MGNSDLAGIQVINSPERPREHSALSASTGDRILAPKIHHRECVGGVPEDSMGVNEVEWVTPSGLRRRAAPATVCWLSSL
ncbi:hypothetical protein N658DRAFT_333307 [Parathielavia hyrcaniae]|uniref:Uncharacterized protein n=1 Tax=Parathielavia hyrcaniae TaxID=113614 RepID=A0AAN6PWE3_9PEZI|nr:hypothetical protein N658DRAFT_333307 [Parathielavia hyrcaniae]